MSLRIATVLTAVLLGLFLNAATIGQVLS
jgi:hypothetical protein